MTEYHIFGQRCDIVEGVVKVGDRTVVIGKNHKDGGLETTTVDVPNEYAEKLADSTDSPIGGTDIYGIPDEADSPNP